MLVAIKLLHTLVWAFLVLAILALPFAGVAGRFDVALVINGLVIVEVFVLALNRWRCPLTAVAGRFTASRSANFDIYMPVWLARHNKGVFGTLFVVGDLVVLGAWLLPRAG